MIYIIDGNIWVAGSPEFLNIWDNAVKDAINRMFPKPSIYEEMITNLMI